MLNMKYFTEKKTNGLINNINTRAKHVKYTVITTIFFPFKHSFFTAELFSHLTSEENVHKPNIFMRRKN